MILYGENYKEVIKWKKLTVNDQSEKVLKWYKTLTQGAVYPCLGLYTYIAIIFKQLLFSNHMANQSQTSCGAAMGLGKCFFSVAGNNTNMAAMPLYGKTRGPSGSESLS